MRAPLCMKGSRSPIDGSWKMSRRKVGKPSRECAHFRSSSRNLLRLDDPGFGLGVCAELRGRALNLSTSYGTILCVGHIDIFISYAEEDVKIIRPLADALMAEGWTVFWDRTIPPGQTWADHVGQKLSSAPVVLVCWSKQSVRSDFVCQEADYAEMLDTLVQVLIEDVEPYEEFTGIPITNLVPFISGTVADIPASIKARITGMLKAASTNAEPS